MRTDIFGGGFVKNAQESVPRCLRFFFPAHMGVGRGLGERRVGATVPWVQFNGLAQVRQSMGELFRGISLKVLPTLQKGVAGPDVVRLDLVRLSLFVLRLRHGKQRDDTGRNPVL